jgi:SAM-dependent methyltransferase
MPIAPRHSVAVAALDLAGHESVLEIGCGQGVAVGLLLQRLTAGTVLAIDRSEKMIARVEATHAAAIGDGRLRTAASALEATDFAGETFDRIVAINLDLNLRLGTRWPPLLMALLKPSGQLVLAFDPPPGTGKATDFATKSLDRLAKAGFAATLLSAHGGVTLIHAEPIAPARSAS